MTVQEWLQWATRHLEERGIENARRDAEHLINFVLRVGSTTRFLTQRERVLLPPEETLLRDLVARRSHRAPLQYLIGTAPFLDEDLMVDERVLIPRPETERLVETAVRIFREEGGNRAPVVFDVGTGSGAIAVSLARVLSARVWASDVSPDAIEVARTNAKRCHVEAQITFLVGNLFDPFPSDLYRTVDVIISNPPYIPTATLDRLAPEISRYEPRIALDGGVDGLDIYRKIIPSAIPFLKEGEGWLMLELGDGQDEMVKRLILNHPEFDVPEIVRDLNQKERVMVCRKRGVM